MLRIVGLCGITVWLLNLLNDLTALALLFCIAVWAVLTGLLQVVAKARPGAGALSVLWLIALFATVYGIVQIGFAFKARGFASRVAEIVRPTM